MAAIVTAMSGLTQSPAAAATVAPLVQQVSTDTLPPYNPNSTSTQHSTEVETDTFSWGSTVVSAFQVGRNYPGFGAQAIGWATSTDSGQTWRHGILPGLTASSPSPTTYPVVVNQSVGYDAKHRSWIVPSVTYVASGTGRFHEVALMINTSPDGINWATATTAVPINVDKAWVSCDNTATSPRYGNCYVAYSQIDSSDALAVVISKEGGRIWSAPVLVPSSVAGTPALGYNAFPVVQRSGRVVLVATDINNGRNGSKMISSISADGGATWSVPGTFATISYHTPPGGVRAQNKPSVDIDASGKVYAAWSDCRFHSGCAADDIVYATTTNGTSWTAPIRVALDPATSTADKFIPGFAVAPGTAGATAQLAVVYYTFVNGACTATTCLLDARYATSYNSGTTWTAPYTINQTSMPLSWLADGARGRMVGDYESVSFCNGSAITVVSLSTSAPNPNFHQAEWALTLPPGWGKTG